MGIQSQKGRVKLGRFPVLVAAALLALGVGLGALIFRTPPPAALAAGAPITFVDVASKQYSDPRSIDVKLVTSDGVGLVAPVSGLLTGSSCTAGGSIASGHSTFELDGAKRLNLFTAKPLWRDLGIGAKGDDVASLHEELTRLGASVSGDTVTSETVKAYNQIANAAGSASVGSITRDMIVWLNAQTVVIQSCPVSLGQTVGQGSVLASVPAVATGATFATWPSDLAPGKRVYVLDQTTVEVGDNGLLGAEALAKLAALPQAKQAGPTGAAPSLSGSLQLAQPLTVFVVPPAALGQSTGTQSCVVVPEGKVSVTIIGSNLGQSYVTASQAIKQVSIARDRDRTCS